MHNNFNKPQRAVMKLREEFDLVVNVAVYYAFQQI